MPTSRSLSAKMIDEKKASPRVLKTAVAAVSVGIVGGEEILDLNYAEDSRAQAVFNVVMTAEGEPFAREQLDWLINLARGGMRELFEIQKVL